MTGGWGVRRLRRVVLAVAGAMVFGACGGADGPGSGDRPGDRLTDLPADHVAWGLHTDINEMGALRARVHGDTVYTWEESGHMRLVPLQARLFDRHGGPTSLITAAEGTLETRTNRMTARGGVVLTDLATGRRLLTAELHYDPAAGRIWSDTTSTLIEEETRVQGSGFEATDDMSAVEVFQSTAEGLEVEREPDR